MPIARRTAFFVSDRTAITVEMLGGSLLTQFPDCSFAQKTLPFIDSPEMAKKAAEDINRATATDGLRAIVFYTFVHARERDILLTADAFFLDCFQPLLLPLEQEMGVKAAQIAGLTHGVKNTGDYHRRIEAINYALKTDDGATRHNLEQADVILTGVSRSGKTPTCLYLAMQYGIFAANYPLTAEDFAANCLPSALLSLQKKLFGLSIEPQRLHRIRTERQPGTHYASLANCESEVRMARKLMQAAQIPMIETTNLSIEEVAAIIRQRMNLG